MATPHRQRAEDGAGGVGELRRLGLFEALDPRDARDPGDDPADDSGPVDQCGGGSHRSAATQERQQPEEDLRRSHGDEQPRQRRMLGVHPDGGGMDRPAPHRRQPLERCDPTRGGGHRLAAWVVCFTHGSTVGPTLCQRYRKSPHNP